MENQSNRSLILDGLRTIGAQRPSGAWGRARDRTAGSKREIKYGLKWARRQDWYEQLVQNVCAASRSTGLPIACIYAIASRESNFGNALDNRGWGDAGNGWGMMQVDRRYHTPQGRWNSVEHIAQASEIAISYFEQIRRKHEDWANKFHVKGMFVAYNSGVGNVATIKKMDRGTTGNDYGADTMARAIYMMENPEC